jgi:ATP-dependent DNA helicase RecQ
LFGAGVVTPEYILHETFGFPAFRGLQGDAVHHVVDGGDALILMPTGGGKSICYQLPALCRPGTGLVVSPLIALRDDQVAALRQLGINAGALHSELEADENTRVSNLLASGKLDLLYVSPERIASPPGATNSARNTALCNASRRSSPACRASR